MIDKIQNAQIQPPDMVWDRLESSLAKKKKRRFLFFLPIAGILIFSSAVAVFSNHVDSNHFISTGKAFKTLNSPVKELLRPTGSSLSIVQKEDECLINDPDEVKKEQRTGVGKVAKRKQEKFTPKDTGVQKDVPPSGPGINSLSSINRIDIKEIPSIQLNPNGLNYPSWYGDLFNPVFSTNDDFVVSCSKKMFAGYHIDQFNQRYLTKEYQNFKKNDLEIGRSSGFFLGFETDLNDQWSVFAALSYRDLRIKGESKEYPISFENVQDFTITNNNSSDDITSIWENIDPIPETQYEFDFKTKYYQLQTGISRKIIGKRAYSINMGLGVQSSIYSSSFMTISDGDVEYENWFSDFSVLLSPQASIRVTDRLDLRAEPQLELNYNKDFSTDLKSPSLFMNYKVGLSFCF